MKKSKKVTLLLAFVVLPLTSCEQKPQEEKLISNGWDNATPIPNSNRPIVYNRPWYYFGRGGDSGAAAANNGFTSKPPSVGVKGGSGISRGGFGTTGHGFSAGS